MRKAEAALDHLLIGAPTLEGGIAWLEERTGVRAAPGGSHLGLGTWNALASLGSRQYIEIIAPDPGQPGVETVYVPGLRDLSEPRIVTWAAQANDLAKLVGSDLPPGFSCGPTRQGQRMRPDGTRLAWNLAFPRHVDAGTFDGAIPFFIEWESTENHPGLVAAPDLALRAFSIRHAEAEPLRHALRALNIDCAVSSAAVMSIRVELETPRGRVVLS